MAGMLTSRTAAQILVDALKIHGVDTAFCVPGESYLAVLDALYDAREAIRLIVARQDRGADSRRCAENPRRRYRVLRSGRELSRGARRSLRRARGYPPDRRAPGQ